LPSLIRGVGLRRKRALGLRVPVPRIRQVAFHDVHDAVCPASERRFFVFLDDLVGGLPVPALEVTNGLLQLSGIERHLSK
jgi:hypothetical protein